MRVVASEAFKINVRPSTNFQRMLVGALDGRGDGGRAELRGAELGEGGLEAADGRARRWHFSRCAPTAVASLPIIFLDTEQGFWQPLMTLIDHLEEQGFLHSRLKNLYVSIRDPEDLPKAFESQLAG